MTIGFRLWRSLAILTRIISVHSGNKNLIRLGLKEDGTRRNGNSGYWELFPRLELK